MMAGTLRVRRSQGALSGVLLVLLGIWGALIPFVGPYFHYAYTPDRAWVATSGRMWLRGPARDRGPGRRHRRAHQPVPAGRRAGRLAGGAGRRLVRGRRP